MYLDVLKSCPFCGSKPEMLETYHKSIKYYIICKNCNIKTYEYDYKLEAINIWNRRAKDNLINKICENKVEIMELLELRDSLLPKLMSGEIKVN
mgnify:CR=1 FL=1